MKLELITGSLRAPLRRHVVAEIRRLSEERCPCFLIVPEQETLAAEKEMSRELPDDAPLYFEATNFTRFADSAFRSLGGIASERPDRARRALVMWQCLTELSPVLRVMGSRGGVTVGQVSRAIAAMNELDSFGIGAEALAEAGAASREAHPRLADKLDDAALIASAYKAALAQKYDGARDEIEALCDRLAEEPNFLHGAHLFVEGFTSFTEAQYRLLCILAERGELSVALPLPRGTEESFEYTETRHAKSRLTKLAARRGIAIKVTRIANDANARSELLADACDSLWRSGARITATEADAERLRIFEGRDPYEECEFVAADIRRRVEAGVRYSDVAIVARDAERYVGILDGALTAGAVPHFFSKRRDVLSFEATRFMCGAIAAVASGFAREDVMTYAKSGFSGITRDACDEFELYAEQWQITGRRFLDEGWSMRPEGYTLRREAGADARLAAINETRATIIEPLARLADAFAAANTIRGFSEALVAFLGAAELEEKIARRSDELYALGEADSAEELAGLWPLLCNALDTLVEAAGDAHADTDSFKSRLELVLGEIRLGRIPAYADEVTVGSADMLRLDRKKHVYLIGVNEGEFPAVPAETSFFSDREKATLPQYNVELGKSSEFDFARELFYFSRAFAAGSESVTLLFSDRDSAFKPSPPAEIVARLAAMTNELVRPRKIRDVPLGEKLFSPEAALAALRRGAPRELAERLAELGLRPRIEAYDRAIVNEGADIGAEAASAAFAGDLGLTQTRIDKYADCPLAYFCQYVIDLKETEEAQFDARNVGSYIHAILESFFAELGRRGASVSELGADERRELAEMAAREYLTALGGGTTARGRFEFMTERLKNAALPVIDGLCDELQGGSYEPRFFELGIEAGVAGSPEAISVELSGGKRARVFGSIDRVDTYRVGSDVYVRVIDYKTGAKVFSPKDLDEGRNLQMFLYLKSVVETRDPEFLARIGVGDGGELIPAGVLYVKAEIGDPKIAHADEEEALAAVRKNQKRDGMLLDDTENLAAMGGGKSVDAIAKRTDRLYTREGWGELCSKVEGSVARVGEALLGGHFKARQGSHGEKNSPCDFCPYKPICRRGFRPAQRH